MQKLLNFLLIVLIFTVLQVTNVGAQDTAAPGSAASGQMDQDCAQLHPGGAATHVDPPESQIEGIEAEYEASCRAGNCALSNATYASLESQGHSRGEVDCFMAEGERDANRGPNDHMNDGQHYDQGNPNDHMNQGSAASGQMDQDCAQLHPGGAATHVDPPESQIDAIEAEYRASCEAGNCALSNATYSSLESQGHSRGEVDCFMAEGERAHNEQHDQGRGGEHMNDDRGRDGRGGEHMNDGRGRDGRGGS